MKRWLDILPDLRNNKSQFNIFIILHMHNNVRSRVRVGDKYSEEFSVEVGVHQGSVLSPLLFIIVLEAHSL